MRMLAALEPRGRFVYAPALPFFEEYLPKNTWNVERRDLPIPHVESRPFQRTCVSRRVQRWCSEWRTSCAETHTA